MRKSAVALFFCFCCSLVLCAKTIPVSPGTPDSVTRAIASARPGDVIELRSGTYSGTIKVRRSGRPEQPIVITAASGASVTIDGGLDPRLDSSFSGEDWGDTSGTDRDNQGIVITNSTWIVIRGLRFVNCWSDVIAIEGSSYITIQDCHMDQCGQRAVATHDLGSHHILIESCRWTQDRRIWTEWDWEELHHRSLWHFNGGLFGGYGASGSVVRRNRVSFVFNGLQWWPENSGGQAQSNIEIYDNTFEYCRDNIIEPEGYAFNLHVYHNKLNSCPRGVFSIDGVDGGNIWIYGNTGRYDENGCADDFWWTLFKFYSGGYQGRGFLDFPLHVYSNSWETGPIFGARGRGEDHVYHINNAMSFFTEDFGYEGPRGVDWICDYDCSSEQWPAVIGQKGFEIHGVIGDPLFVNPGRDDFRLKGGSPCIDTGKIIDGFTQFYVGNGPDIGAMESDLPVYGRPFVHIDPPGQKPYGELPRIARCFSYGSRLAIFFSTNLVPGTVGPSDVSLTVRGVPITIEQVVYPGNQRIMTLTVDQSIPHGSKLDLAFGSLPRGANGQTGTMWAADLIVVGIPENAVLVDEMALAFDDSVAPAPSAPTTPPASEPPYKDF